MNVGPNLTWSGSLATLLWRRSLGSHAPPFDVFARLGAVTVPTAGAGGVIALWLVAGVVR